ncbi:hypothetical protein MmiAt1_06300 [Methanimicrococcus sp. At1]|uniref:CHAD domain-containing protein n=1 Tax=Methanimicrococcus hacksteinii TaxID=3028293 RepID=A0ABU3VP48_9EURY|nr:CHAD domain-containing protein [Methanimicrococcus sp. At1]MDV0445074.1 hypothetical protein [Methanimicrococcus sp. At1]
MSGTHKLEIEYKFGIENSGTFEFLSRLEQAGEYKIRDKSHPLFTDIFYDTPDFLLYALGFYLRKRLEDGRDEAVWTLKKAEASADEDENNDEANEAHKRYEIIQILPLDSTCADISDPDLKNTLTAVLGETELIPVLTLEQDRIFKTVLQKGSGEDSETDFSKNRLGDLSVDSVSLTLSEQKHTFTELEIELADGTENDLKEFIETLKSLPELQNNLTVNRFSKFERGLILYFNRDKIEGKVVPGFEKRLSLPNPGGEENENGRENENGKEKTDSGEYENGKGNDENKIVFEYDSAGSGFLLPREKASLMQIAGKDYTSDSTDYFSGTAFTGRDVNFGETGFRNEDLFTKNASVLLALDSGMSFGFAAQVFQTEVKEAAEIRSSFEKGRLEMFPFVFEMNTDSPYYYQKPADDGKVWTAEELVSYYGLDAGQAFGNAENADRFFDFAGPANGLTEKDRSLLKAAALLSGIGKGISVERNIKPAADVILTHPIKDLTLNEIKMLALIFDLREIKNPAADKIRKTIRKSGFFLPPAFQKKAAVLTAILETAASISDAGGKVEKTETTKGESEGETEKRIVKISYRSFETEETKKEIRLKNPEKGFAKEAFDFMIAYEKSPAGDETKKPDAESAMKPDLKINASDMMAVAAEKIFINQIYESDKAEPGVISARDIEDVHDMRVALRKIRSAIIIFKDYLDPEWLAETESEIKKTLSGLGELRDLDVILEKTDSWLKAEKIEKEKLSVFYETVAADRNKAHAIAVDYLGSEDYLSFKAELKKTLDGNVYLGMPHINKKGDVAPTRICDVLPSILYQKAADVTAYHEWMDGPYIYVDKLHRLRIAAKNFRYTLDFFKDCLGDAAGQLIKEFKELQDILGDFHDAVVAVEVIGDYIEKIRKEADVIKEDGRLRQIETTLETLSDYKNYRKEEMETLLSVFHTKWEKMNRRFFNERITKIIAEADF